MHTAIDIGDHISLFFGRFKNRNTEDVKMNSIASINLLGHYYLSMVFESLSREQSGSNG